MYACLFRKPNLALNNFVLINRNHTKPPKEFTLEYAKQIEKHWRPILEKSHEKYAENNSQEKTKPKKYVLSMFPYPSGNLHLGHVRVYTLSDTLARYNRMKGYNVIHPIGWDSFGLPAENAAIERKLNPATWTETNIQYMKNQLNELTFSFDWNRELSTCDPSYYKWTQYIFLQLFLNGVTVQKEALVNWDPVDKTVLANEQIDENGRSWRSGCLVEKKILKQWFIKSSVYAKSLLDELEGLSTDDWNIVKSIQKTWIGKCNGCLIDFKIKFENSEANDSIITVFTDVPYGIYGISHIDISKHHIILKNLTNVKENEKLNCYAVNPFNGDKIPIYLKDDSVFGAVDLQGVPHVDSRLGIPSLNENDKNFANDLKLPYKDILDNTSGKLINSNELTNLDKNEAFEKILKKLTEMNLGGDLTSEKLNDWCISRQRYWGTPIPLIYCNKCKIVPVPFEQLPVELPKIENLSEKGASGLKNSSWANVECPKCKGPAVRETDTMDTFMDSAWYYFRYLDVKNNREPFGDLGKEQMPVDIYIGGAEHAMTHLFVSRLISHFFFDQNKLKSKEPFKRFVAIGMVKGETFKTKAGKYVPSSQVITKDNKYYEKETNEMLEKSFEKMSKSKLNGIEPQFMVQKYGVDFTRLFLLSFVHPKSDRNFLLSEDMIIGTLNLLKTIWALVDDAATHLESNETKTIKENEKLNKEMYQIRNTQLGMITFSLDDTFNLPVYLVAISKIVKFMKKFPIESYNERYYQLLVEILIMFSPVIPHFTSECWNRLKTNIPTTKFELNKLIVEQRWPELDLDWLIDINLKMKKKTVSLTKVTPDVFNGLDLEKTIDLVKNNDIFKQNVKESLDKYRINFEKRGTLNGVLSVSNLKE